MFLFLLIPVILAKENWKCFDWPSHRNFTRDSSLYQECNKQCGWISSCTPCRIINTDLYSCMDTQSEIDTYVYSCGDLNKQHSCIIEQGIMFWFIMASCFILIVCFVGVLIYCAIRDWSK